eukprot:CAMPEP_0184023924 /NCGR_PEP_ID=MMETSP0954-20121128/11704_1 /TAXON_ID=627963 /ORGANISM="Aplanochytrium sp, Strain PBS07" /LENGTH=1168 /DNA_ID=CAMNT_0026307009 /DNA_START=891 /DNA_END=4397 /DNA_ORIENTATION=-
MESQTEKVITVIMNQVVEGIPNLKGGYLEQPIESEATRFLNNAGGFADAAVSAAAYELITPLTHPSWSKSVWRGTLRAVVGQLPWVGTATAVFTSQFESLWKQIRFFALAATLYGHNPRDEATQCQIVLCLLDDKLLNGGTSANRVDETGESSKKINLDFETELKQGTLKFAATVVARKVFVQYSISTINSTVLFNRVLGGLLAGVMPGVVHSLYNAVALGNQYENQEHLANRVRMAVKTSKEHFKAEEQPTLAIARTAFVAWLVPNVLKQGAKIDSMARSLILQNSFMETHLASLTMWYVFEALVVAVLALFLLWFGYWKNISSCGTVLVSRLPPWLVSTITLLLRAFLHFLSVKNTAFSFAKSFTKADIYHGHRAIVGIASLVSRKSFAKDLNLQPFLPFIHGSLLIWILYSLLIWFGNYVVMIISVLANDITSFDKLLELHHTLESSGFTMSRVGDALDVISTVSLHVLVHQIQKSEIIISLLGPVTVVDGIMFAAKSLGTFVTKPDHILQWLASASPPPLFAWTIFACQACSLFLGVFWGFLSEVDVGVTEREKYVATYAVLLTICIVSKDRKLPPPFQKKTWEDALSTRHRLLFLIPELDSGVKSKLHFVIKFFEQYEKAFVHTTSTWSASINWIESKWVGVKASAKRYIRGSDGEEYQFVETYEVPPEEYLGKKPESKGYASWFQSGNTSKEISSEDTDLHLDGSSEVSEAVVDTSQSSGRQDVPTSELEHNPTSKENESILQTTFSKADSPVETQRSLFSWMRRSPSDETNRDSSLVIEAESTENNAVACSPKPGTVECRESSEIGSPGQVSCSTSSTCITDNNEPSVNGDTQDESVLTDSSKEDIEDSVASREREEDECDTTTPRFSSFIPWFRGTNSNTVPDKMPEVVDNIGDEGSDGQAASRYDEKEPLESETDYVDKPNSTDETNSADETIAVDETNARSSLYTRWFRSKSDMPGGRNEQQNESSQRSYFSWIGSTPAKEKRENDAGTKEESLKSNSTSDMVSWMWKRGAPESTTAEEDSGDTPVSNSEEDSATEENIVADSLSSHELDTFGASEENLENVSTKPKQYLPWQRFRELPTAKKSQVEEGTDDLPTSDEVENETSMSYVQRWMFSRNKNVPDVEMKEMTEMGKEEDVSVSHTLDSTHILEDNKEKMIDS